jgi:hypothetical protein
VAASLAFAVETVLIDRWVTPAQARWYAGFQMAGLTFWTALWSFLTGSSLAAPANPTWAWALVVLLAVFPSWLAFKWQMTAQPRLNVPGEFCLRLGAPAGGPPVGLPAGRAAEPGAVGRGLAPRRGDNRPLEPDGLQAGQGLRSGPEPPGEWHDSC